MCIRDSQWAEHRLLPFWEDVQAKAAEVISGESRFEHYMGCLLYTSDAADERSSVDLGGRRIIKKKKKKIDI
mgnify:CR=1 FL=1